MSSHIGTCKNLNMTAVILAGGKSKRMQTNKALLTFHRKPMVSHISELLHGIFDDIIVVASNILDYSSAGVTTVTDLIKDRGPLGGLYTGLFYAPGSHVFVVGCDMPLLNREVIRYLINQVNPSLDVIVPLLPGGYEPLHAVYSRKCLKLIETHLRYEKLKITALYDRLRIKAVVAGEFDQFDPMGISFFNVNSPEDFARAQLLSQGLLGTAPRKHVP
ncbi:MAG: molybdenum cofactor guanylyltransferase [Pseudomonadota bacterium]